MKTANVSFLCGWTGQALWEKRILYGSAFSSPTIEIINENGLFSFRHDDTNNILVSDEFQRVLTKEDFYDRIKEVKLNNKLFDKVRNDFLKKLPTEDEYYKEFEGVLNKCFKLQ